MSTGARGDLFGDPHWIAPGTLRRHVGAAAGRLGRASAT